MQGGHNPYIPFEWYLDLLRTSRRIIPIHIHGFSPSEVDFFAKTFRMDARDVIRELMKAGLDSIPGGGGEILVQRVRDLVAKKKAGADRWLEIMEIAHQEGMKTSVTMMYGIGETLAERIEHLERVRDVQARTNGFTAFICWPLQPENTPTMSHMQKTDASNISVPSRSRASCSTTCPNLQASWVTMGLKVGQTALRFGCNDFGSLMIEENVVSAATRRTGRRPKRSSGSITDAGFIVASTETGLFAAWIAGGGKRESGKRAARKPPLRPEARPRESARRSRFPRPASRFPRRHRIRLSSLRAAWAVDPRRRFHSKRRASRGSFRR